MIRRWNFESIDLYLWKLPIFFLGLFWIVVISLVLLSAHYGHNCQILSKYYHDYLLQKTKNSIQPGPLNVLGPKYVKNISSHSLKNVKIETTYFLSVCIFFEGREEIFFIFWAKKTAQFWQNGRFSSDFTYKNTTSYIQVLLSILFS